MPGTLSKIKTLFNGVASAYLLPIKPSKVIFALGLQQIICFGSGALLYSSATDVMKELGIENVPVRHAWMPAYLKPVPTEHTIKDKIHNMTEIPTIFGIVGGWQNDYKPSEAHAMSGLGCQISIPSMEKRRPYDILVQYTGLPQSAFASLPLTNKDIWVASFLHEYGHCKPQIPFLGLFKKASNFVTNSTGLNKITGQFNIEKDKNESETIADLTYLSWLKTQPPSYNPADKATYLLNMRAVIPFYVRSIDFDIEHDTMLSLDAFLKERPRPAFEDIMHSRMELSALVNAELGKIKYISEFKIGEYAYASTIKATQYALEKNADTISPLAKRRGELFLQATAYFFPELYVRATNIHKLTPVLPPFRFKRDESILKFGP